MCEQIINGTLDWNASIIAGYNSATAVPEVVTIATGRFLDFAIPTAKNWTLIFNKVADQWGAFEYNEAEDALRFEVTPEEGNMQEWLAYTITKTSDNSAIVSLEWERLKVLFTIEVSID